MSIGDPTFGTAVQTATSATVVASITGVTAGDTLILFTSNRSGTAGPTGVVDDTNVLWTIDATRGIGSGAEGVFSGIYFYPVSAAGSGTIAVTVTYAGAADTHIAHVARITPTGTIVLSDTATGSSNAATSHPLSTTLDIVSNGIAFATSVSASGLTKTVATGFMQAANDGGLRQFAQWQNITGGGGLSDNVTWTSTAGGNNALAGLVLTESGVAVVRRGMLMKGVG